MTINTFTGRHKLTKTQRQSLGGKAYTPRIRAENEALPITFVESSLNHMPKMEPSRAGADNHLSIGRVGVYC